MESVAVHDTITSGTSPDRDEHPFAVGRHGERFGIGDSSVENLDHRIGTG
jgi:hypothetical protein